MTDKEFLEHLQDIIDSGLECRAIRLLSDSVEYKLCITHAKKKEAEAKVRAIKKLNKGKNPAIELLCEKEGESDA